MMMKQGRYLSYHRNGRIERDCHFLNNELHGPYVSWFFTGFKSVEGNFVQGKKEGNFIEWNLMGDHCVLVYQNDIIINRYIPQ